jgi:hypothetical protein
MSTYITTEAWSAPWRVQTSKTYASPGSVYTTDAYNAPGRVYNTGAWGAPGHVYTSGVLVTPLRVQTLRTCIAPEPERVIITEAYAAPERVCTTGAWAELGRVYPTVYKDQRYIWTSLFYRDLRAHGLACAAPGNVYNAYYSGLSCTRTCLLYTTDAYAKPGRVYTVQMLVLHPDVSTLYIDACAASRRANTCWFINCTWTRFFIILNNTHMI